MALPNGEVLVAGGIRYWSDSTIWVGAEVAELYNPATGSFSETGRMTTARDRFTATLLANGTVLLAGGRDGTQAQLASAELYDSATGLFAATGSFAGGVRASHAAALLPTGKVLVVGGTAGVYYERSDSELYDPTTGAFSGGAQTVAPRTMSTATLLSSNGKVLVVAGNYVPSSAAAELYGNPQLCY